MLTEAMSQAARLVREAQTAQQQAEPVRRQEADEDYFDNFSAYRGSW